MPIFHIEVKHRALYNSTNNTHKHTSHTHTHTYTSLTGNRYKDSSEKS